MTASLFFQKIQDLINQLSHNSLESIQDAAKYMADSIAQGRAVYYYGSGHSILPVLDVFPRYGSFVGLQPIHDTRLMWFNVIGPGGTPELLWLERQEGYVKHVLDSYVLDPRDTLIVISHGGLNAAGIEAAILAKEHGLKVIAITSLKNYFAAQPRHSSGKKLADIADIVIDNGAPPEDSLVYIEGWDEPVAASSTIAAICISMALVAETASLLARQNIHIPTFVSPNVLKDAEHNLHVYEVYREFRRKIY
mgnify:CR=1 FL=1